MTVSEVSFGRWLKSRRKQLGLSQQNLSQQISCAAVTLRKIEADARRPSERLAERLADSLLLANEDRDAFMRFARMEPHIAASYEDKPSKDRSSRFPRRQIILPTPQTPLIGRDLDVMTVAGRIMDDGVRLLTLLGPPGVGKTRLGIETLRTLSGAFADGVCMVTLASAPDPALIASLIAQGIGLAEIGRQSMRNRLFDALEEKRLLLMLDNFEHVLEARSLLVDMLAACPLLKIVVTSREALRVENEEVFAVHPLATPGMDALPGPQALAHYPAVELFVARAQRVKPKFSLTNANAAAVAAICTQLDGLPLAIELVAAYVKLFSPRALLAQLKRRLKQSSLGARDLPKRQSTLWKAIGWSYDLLQPDEQQLFARLAVFSGFTPETAEAICNAEGQPEIDIVDGMMGLLDKSLLAQQKDTDENPRFAMLLTVREYAIERLAASSAADIFQRQHAEFFLALAEQAEPFLRGPRQDEWLDRLDLDHGNMRLALAWSLSDSGDPALGLRMAAALWWFWHRRGYMNEGRHWLETALERNEKVGAITPHAHVLHAAGVFTWLQGDYAVARKLLERGMALWRELGDQRGLAHTVNYLGMVVLHQDDPVITRHLHEESLGLFQKVGDQWGVALALRNLGMVALVQEDLEKATTLYKQGMQAFRDVRDKWGMIVVLNDLGEIARAEGRYDRATELYQESLALSRLIKDKWLSAMVLHNLAQVALYRGEYERASALIEESLLLWRDLGNKPGMTLCLAVLAGVIVKSDSSKQAVRLFGAADALFDRKIIRTALLDQVEYNRNLAAARAQIDEGIFAVLWTEGQTMGIEEGTEPAWIHERETHH